MRYRPQTTIWFAWLILLPISTAKGLDIQVSFDAGGSLPVDFPAYDPNASLLGGLVQYAATVYEDLIEDNHVLQLTYRWDKSLAEDTGVNVAKHDFGTESAGREVSGGLRFDTDAAWFIDPTPTDDSEFNMASALYRDLNSAQQASRFSGDVPDTFETGYLGDAFSTAPVAAQNNFDLLTIVLHEMGHALGLSGGLSSLINETSDNDFDIPPSFVGGRFMAELPRVTTAGPLDPTHLFGFGTNPPAGEISGPSVMSTIGRGERRLPSAADVFAMSSVSNWLDLDLGRLEFLSGAFWDSGSSWLGGKVPNGDDVVSIRTGDAVLLGLDAISSELLVDDGSFIFTGGSLLWAIDQATIGGAGQAEVVVGGLFGPVAGGTFLGNRLVVNPGGTVRLNGGSTLADAAEVNMLDVELAGVIATNISTRGLWNADTEVVADSEVSIGAGGRLDFNGNLSGAADLTKTGAGQLVLAGFNGGWSGDLVVQEGSVKMDSTNALSDSTTLVLADNTRADFTSSSETLGALEGSGTVLLGATNPLVNRQVVVGLNNSNTVFTGAIQSPTGSLVKGGLGSMTFGPGASVRVGQMQSRGGGSLVVAGGELDVGLLDTEAEFGPFGIVLGSTVRIESGSIVVVDVMVNPSNRVQIAGGSLSTSQMITVDDGLLEITGGTVQAEALALLNGGMLDMTGGRLAVETVSGNLLVAGGTLAPGDSPGVTTVSGNYTQQNAATLEIEIGGLAAGSEHDQVTVAGAASLAGTLDVLLTGGFAPAPGDVFEIITAASILGTFAVESLPILPGGLEWFVNYRGTSVELVSTYGADFDEDGDVDGDDLAGWEGGFGSAPAAHIDGDANADALANGFDFLTWQRQLGSGGAAVAATAIVPEPSTWPMLLVAMSAFMMRKRLRTTSVEARPRKGAAQIHVKMHARQLSFRPPVCHTTPLRIFWWLNI